MIVGIGVDIIHVDRIEKSMDNPRFIQRVFTPVEQAYIQKRGFPSAAGIFAAKEAVSKALGTGFVGFSLLDVELGHDALGKPEVILYRKALSLLEALQGMIWISISHCSNLAIAQVIIERGDKDA